VPLRPDGSPAEEKCPEGAREAITSLGLEPGSATDAFVEVTRKVPGPLIVYDGPVESETWGPMEELPGRTRLLGRIWTSGPRVVIRYYSARLPDGKVIPFCAVAADNGPGLPKTPGRPGSAALEGPAVRIYITGQFR
jgi:hypothetical protein